VAKLKVKSRLIWAYLIQSTEGIFAFFTTLAFARILGPLQIGEIGRIIAGFSMFFPLIEGGINNYTTRAIAQSETEYREYFTLAILSRFLYSLPLMLCLALILYYIGVLPERRFLVWSASFVYLFSTLYYGTTYCVYSGKLEFKEWWKLSLIAKTSSFVLATLCAFLTRRISYAYLASSIFIIMWINLIWFRHRAAIVQQLGRRLFKVVKSSLPFMLWNLSSSIGLHFDSFWLGITRSAGETGLYIATYRLYLLSNSVFIGLFVVMFPVLSKQFTSDIAGSHLNAIRVIFVTACVSVLIGAILVLKSNDIIYTLFGTAFAEAGPILKLLGIAVIPTSINRALGNVLNAFNKEKVTATSAFMASLLNVGLNIWLIPQYGAVAAAWITIISEFTCMLLLCVLGRSVLSS